jgi:predicted RNase H-like nuclease
VFPVPLRLALAAASRADADTRSRRAGGPGVSCQSFGISGKIAELDAFMQQRSERQLLRPPIRECHPELCFWALNHHRPMLYSKKTQRGYDERKAVLRNFLSDFDSQLADLQEGFRAARWRINGASRGDRAIDFQRDDLIDAIVVAVTAAGCCVRGLLTIPANPEIDAHGLPMEMVYCDSGPAA